MAIIVAVERKWITREAAVDRLLTIVKFLLKADSYHGIFPHWLNGATGKTIPFSRRDDGADIVESSYLFQGLLTVKEYFNTSDPKRKTVKQHDHLVMERCRMELAHTRGIKYAILALEP